MQGRSLGSRKMVGHVVLTEAGKWIVVRSTEDMEGDAGREMLVYDGSTVERRKLYQT